MRPIYSVSQLTCLSDNIVRFKHRVFKLCDFALARPHVSRGKGRRRRASLGLLFVRVFLRALNPPLQFLYDAQVCDRPLSLSELRCYRWVRRGLIISHLSEFFRKQARRTGMAGPLGEMFDHGKTKPRLQSSFLTFSRLRCDEHDGRNLNDASDPFLTVSPARSHSRLPGTQSWALVVDRRVANGNTRQLLSDYLGGVSHRSVFPRHCPAELNVSSH
jgi:hypothetical protein